MEEGVKAGREARSRGWGKRGSIGRQGREDPRLWGRGAGRRQKWQGGRHKQGAPPPHTTCPPAKVEGMN